MTDQLVADKVKTILSELRDVNKERRRTAVMKLGMVGGDEAVRTLINIVNNGQEDLIVRGRAALMLGKLKDDRAVPHLIRALEAPGFLTPYHAAQALGKIGDPRAVEALLDFAGSSRDKTRDAAMQALRRLGFESEGLAISEPHSDISYSDETLSSWPKSVN